MNTSIGAASAKILLPAERDVDTTALTKAAWRLLPLLMFAYLCSYIDRINVGFAKLEMAQDLSFSDTVYGFGAGIFFLGYFLFEVPSNLLLHRFGARVWITRIMITWGLISGAIMFVSTPMQFYIMRFLLGAGEAGFIPGVIYFLTYWFPSYWRGRVLGVFYIALATSGVIGGALSSLILQDLSGVAGLHGWQWLFVVEAVPTIAAGLLIYLFLVDRPADAAWLQPEEREAITAAINSEGQTQPGAIGLAAGATSLFAILTMVAAGRSADRRKERRWHLAALFLCGAAGFAIAGFGEHGALVGLIGLCLAQMGILAVPVVLGTTDRDLGRDQCRSGYRSDQLPRQPVRVPESLPRGLRKGRDRRNGRLDLPDRRPVGACRAVDPPRAGEIGKQVDKRGALGVRRFALPVNSAFESITER